VALSLALVTSAPPAAHALPPIKHVFVIVLENSGYARNFGPRSPAPYLSGTLPATGALLVDFKAITHPSLPNYLALVSGQPPNPATRTNCPVLLGACTYKADVPTLPGQLEDAGLSWRGYMEDMANGPPGQPRTCRGPGTGPIDPTQGARRGDQYAARHDPFPYFRELRKSGSCARNDVDYARLARDLRSPTTTPSFALIVPNLCNDGHDDPCVDGSKGGLERADAWLRREMPRILGSPGFRDRGLLVVTFDEAESGGPGGGQIGAVLVSPFIAPGTVVSTAYDHYSLLRTIEDVFGLRHLGLAARPGARSFGDDVFGPRAPTVAVGAGGRL
jgi:phosphatidylinositol-3-phosphatase